MPVADSLLADNAVNGTVASVAVTIAVLGSVVSVCSMLNCSGVNCWLVSWADCHEARLADSSVVSSVLLARLVSASGCEHDLDAAVCCALPLSPPSSVLVAIEDWGCSSADSSNAVSLAVVVPAIMVSALASDASAEIEVVVMTILAPLDRHVSLPSGHGIFPVF